MPRNRLNALSRRQSLFEPFALNGIHAILTAIRGALDKNPERNNAFKLALRFPSPGRKRRDLSRGRDEVSFPPAATLLP
jgi:hypothetical protein